jgi:hypothetical protein
MPRVIVLLFTRVPYHQDAHQGLLQGYILDAEFSYIACFIDVKQVKMPAGLVPYRVFSPDLEQPGDSRDVPKFSFMPQATFNKNRRLRRFSIDSFLQLALYGNKLTLTTSPPSFSTSGENP